MINRELILLFPVVCLFLLAAISPGSLDAQEAQAAKDVDIVGVWSATAETEQGKKNSTWTFVKSADAYNGQYQSSESDESQEVTNISLDGDTLKFEITVELDEQELLIKVDSKVDGGKLTGTWEAIGDGNELAAGTLVAEKQVAIEFDGSSIESFRGYANEKVGSGWSMTDGALHFDGTKGGDLITKQTFGDFELEFEWKISEAGNSGIMYRVSLGDNQPYLSGPEYQILDDDKHSDGKLESHRAGALYALYVPTNKTLKPVGQWNSSKIVLNGNSVEHWLNGSKVVEAELGSDDWNEKVAASKFKDWAKFGKNKQGHIAFQDHGDPVWYRNIRIKSLD